jgi:hypothetical protein
VRGQSKSKGNETAGAQRFQRTAPAVVAPVSLGPRVVELFQEEDSDLHTLSASEVRCAALRFAARAGRRAWAQVCCAGRARHRRRRSWKSGPVRSSATTTPYALTQALWVVACSSRVIAAEIFTIVAAMAIGRRALGSGGFGMPTRRAGARYTTGYDRKFAYGWSKS